MCLFNVFILLNAVSYIQTNFILKIDSKMCSLKNLNKIWKIKKKTSGNPDCAHKPIHCN